MRIGNQRFFIIFNPFHLKVFKVLLTARLPSNLTLSCCSYIDFFVDFSGSKFFSILAIHKPSLGSCEVPPKT